jgi:hypothetical protein
MTYPDQLNIRLLFFIPFAFVYYTPHSLDQEKKKTGLKASNFQCR